VKLGVDCASMSEDYHHHFVAFDRVDAPIWRNPNSPDVLITEQLVDIEVNRGSTWVLLEQRKAGVELPSSLIGE